MLNLLVEVVSFTILHVLFLTVIVCLLFSSVDL